MDLNSLMNSSLDALADLPAFEVPPNGSYTLDLTIIPKEKDGKTAIYFSYEVVACMEQADPSAKPAELKQKFMESFQLDNEIGAGMFKAKAAIIMKHLSLTTFGELFTKAKNLRCFGVVKQRHYKDKSSGDDRINADVLNLSIL